MRRFIKCSTFLTFIVTVLACQPVRGQNSFQSEFKGNILSLESYHVHYIKKGQGNPILLIHGGGTWMYSWRNIIDSLAKDFTVYAVDMPGHGYTTVKNKPDYDLPYFAKFINDFMAAQKLDHITLVGNSWGGGWALYYAQQFPHKVDNLILIDAAGLSVKDVFEWEILKYPVIGEITTCMITRKNVRQGYEKSYFDKSLITQALVEETYYPLKIRENQKAMYKIKRRCDWKVTEKQMSNVSTPTLIIWGAEDAYLSVKNAETYHAQMPNSTLRVIEKCGHTPQEERPEITIKYIKDFLVKS